MGSNCAESDCCLSDVLSEAGYNCGYIGKWHLDLPKTEHVAYTEGWRGRPGTGSVWDAYTPPGPRRHGFDFWHSYGCCDRHLSRTTGKAMPRWKERIDVDEWSVKHETDVAIKYLENRNRKHRDADTPFALFVAHNPPHTPFEQVPEEYHAAYTDMPIESLLNRPNVQKEPDGQRAIQHVRNYFAAVTGIDENVGRILDTLDREGWRRTRSLSSPLTTVR